MKKQRIFSVSLSAIILIFSIFIPANIVFADTSGTPENIPLTRIAGEDRYETAVKISQEGWEDGSAAYAVLAAGMNQNLVDALTAAPLAKAKDAPILLTGGKHLNSHTKEELIRLGVTTVYVTSGLGVITQPVIDELTAMNITVIPLGGSNRFATALNIADVVGFHGKLVLASGYSNADALSIAAIEPNSPCPSC